VYSLSRYFGRKVQLGPANRRQKLGLVWRNRKKISQIINDYLCLPFFLLIILCYKVSPDCLLFVKGPDSYNRPPYLGLDLTPGRDLMPLIPTMAPSPIMAAVPAPSFPATKYCKCKIKNDRYISGKKIKKVHKISKIGPKLEDSSKKTYFHSNI
jgi:hypothetical protein